MTKIQMHIRISNTTQNQNICRSGGIKQIAT